MRLLVPTLLVVSSSAVFAERATERRAVTGFTAIDASGGVELVITKGPFGVTLEGDADELERFTSTVTGGTLRLERGGFGFSFGRPVTARVSLPSLEKLRVRGGVSASLTGATAKELTVELEGGASLRAEQLELDRLTLDGSGGSVVKLAGKTQKMLVDLSGGATLEATALVATAAVLDASGGCSVDLTVKSAVRGEASGGTDVRVHGSPSVSAIEASGGSSVTTVASK